MTISPPAKAQSPSGRPAGAASAAALVASEPARVLAHGLDKLDLAIDVSWTREDCFDMLRQLKETATAQRQKVSGQLGFADGSDPWLFDLEPFGRDGYAWLLRSSSMSLKVGDWIEPGSRPSILAEISSEALWANGPHAILDFLCMLLEEQGAVVREMKASRADLCVDVLLRERDWHADYNRHINSRAHKLGLYYDNRSLTGVSIGRGSLLARLYDKPLEIRQQSGKVWMYDIWGLPAVPDGNRIIRIEFQVRREKLKEMELGLAWDRRWLEGDQDQPSTVTPLLAGLENVWAYCTRNWLKLVDDVTKRSNRQKVLPWWGVVQRGFGESFHRNPAILSKAVAASADQLVRQAVGQMTSLTALLSQRQELAEFGGADLDAQLKMFGSAIRSAGFADDQLNEKVHSKLARHRRRAEQHRSRLAERSGLKIATYHEQPINRPTQGLDQPVPQEVSCSLTSKGRPSE